MDKQLREVWRNMMRRCYQPTMTRYERYGGRGIKVCDEWHDYAAFEKWAIDSGYFERRKRAGKNRKKYPTIDRADNNGNYCPENCQWATYLEQVRNRGDSIIWSDEKLVISPCKGVCWNKDKNKWMARITVCGKRIFLGLFNTLDDADAAYKKAKEDGRFVSTS